MHLQKKFKVNRSMQHGIARIFQVSARVFKTHGLQADIVCHVLRELHTGL